jgi:hypothetical protein
MSYAFSSNHYLPAIAEYILELNTPLADIVQRFWSNLFARPSQRIRLYSERVSMAGLVRLQKSQFLFCLLLGRKFYSRITFDAAP